MTCKTCRWFAPEPRNPDCGECCYDPPTAEVLGDALLAASPPILASRKPCSRYEQERA